MRTATTLAVVLLAATPAVAQVFPGISAGAAEAEVKKAESAGNSTADAKPSEVEKPAVPSEVAEPPKPTGENGTTLTKEQRELERKFKDALSNNSILAEKRVVDRHASPLIKAGFNDFKDYTTGLLNLYAESFSAACSDLTKFVPPNTLSEENPNRTGMWNAAKGGEGLLLGHMAKCYSEFDDTVRNERLVKSRFKQAADYARGAAKAMRAKAGMAPWDQDGLIDRAGTLERFAEEGEATWVACWTAAEAARAKPWDFDVVLTYARSLYVSSRLELNMRQRLVLRYLMTNFPEHEQVKNGELAVLMSWNLVRTWQFEDARTLIDKAVIDNGGNKERSESLRNSRNAMGQERTRIERGLLKIARRD